MHRDDIRLRGRGERLPAPSFYEGQAFLRELVQECSSARQRFAQRGIFT